MPQNKENKKPVKRNVQAILVGNEVEDIDLIKKTYGHKSDASITRFLICQIAQNIRNGKPSILIN